VKLCIEDYRRAGISVWMLTGDMGLTAKQVAIDCGLYQPEDSLGVTSIHLDETTTSIQQAAHA